MANYHTLSNNCTKRQCVMEGVILECSLRSTVFKDTSYMVEGISYIGMEYIQGKSFQGFTCKILDVFTGLPLDISFSELTTHRNAGYITSWSHASKLSAIGPRDYVRFEYRDTKQGYDLKNVQNYGALSRTEHEEKKSQREAEDLKIFRTYGETSLSYQHHVEIDDCSRTKGAPLYVIGRLLDINYDDDDSEISLSIEVGHRREHLTLHSENYERLPYLWPYNAGYEKLRKLKVGQYFRLVYIKNADAKSCQIRTDEISLYDWKGTYQHPKFNYLFWLQPCLGKDIEDEIKKTGIIHKVPENFSNLSKKAQEKARRKVDRKNYKEAEARREESAKEAAKKRDIEEIMKMQAEFQKNQARKLEYSRLSLLSRKKRKKKILEFIRRHNSEPCSSPLIPTNWYRLDIKTIEKFGGFKTDFTFFDSIIKKILVICPIDEFIKDKQRYYYYVLRPKLRKLFK